MKKFLGFILFIFLICSSNCYAAGFNILVIPNDLLNNQKDYLIYQKSASLIGTDIINYYNQQSNMSAVQINQVRSYLEKPENYRLRKEVYKMLEDYQANYTINFATIQKLASKFGAKQVLLISCNMDTQNYVTRRTLWDVLNIPGATVIDPAYRLTTQVNLIDVNNQVVLWQNNYQKLISSRESRMITPTLGDVSEQLEKVKKYSVKFLSPQIVQETQLALLNMSPYQNLNLHPEIVKPHYVSIDKIKVDSKRGGVRSARYMKNQSILAGEAVAAETMKLAKKSKIGFTKMKNNVSDKIEQQKLLAQRQAEMPIEDQIQQINEKEQAKLELKKAKQKLKLEKQKRKAQLKAAKQKAKMQAKIELENEKQQLLMQNEVHENVQKVKTKKQEFVKEDSLEKFNSNENVNSDGNFVKNIKFFKKQPQQKNVNEINTQNLKEKEISKPEVKLPKEADIVPPSTIIRENYKPIPYIRTKTILREKEYTINDY